MFPFQNYELFWIGLDTKASTKYCGVFVLITCVICTLVSGVTKVKQKQRRKNDVNSGEEA